MNRWLEMAIFSLTAGALAAAAVSCVPDARADDCLQIPTATVVRGVGGAYVVAAGRNCGDAPIDVAATFEVVANDGLSVPVTARASHLAPGAAWRIREPAPDDSVGVAGWTASSWSHR